MELPSSAALGRAATRKGIKMVIHHSQTKKAEKLGFIMSEQGESIVIHWPERNWKFPFDNAKEAIEKMTLIKNHAEPDPNMTYSQALQLIGREPQAEQPTEDDNLRNDAGMALDGGVAFAEGVARDENPYTNETLNKRWAEQWDAANAEANPPEEQEDKHQEGDGEFKEDDEGTPVGEKSVVKSRYRVKYAELGHPKHCGDWLAQVLNNLVA